MSDERKLEPGEWPVGYTKAAEAYNVGVTIAAESKAGIPDRILCYVFPVQRPVPIATSYSQKHHKQCLNVRTLNDQCSHNLDVMMSHKDAETTGANLRMRPYRVLSSI